MSCCSHRKSLKSDMWIFFINHHSRSAGIKVKIRKPFWKYLDQRLKHKEIMKLQIFSQNCGGDQSLVKSISQGLFRNTDQISIPHISKFQKKIKNGIEIIRDLNTRNHGEFTNHIVAVFLSHQMISVQKKKKGKQNTTGKWRKRRAMQCNCEGFSTYIIYSDGASRNPKTGGGAPSELPFCWAFLFSWLVLVNLKLGPTHKIFG